MKATVIDCPQPASRSFAYILPRFFREADDRSRPCYRISVFLFHSLDCTGTLSPNIYFFYFNINIRTVVVQLMLFDLSDSFSCRVNLDFAVNLDGVLDFCDFS